MKDRKGCHPKMIIIGFRIEAACADLVLAQLQTKRWPQFQSPQYGSKLVPFLWVHSGNRTPLPAKITIRTAVEINRNQLKQTWMFFFMTAGPFPGQPQVMIHSDESHPPFLLSYL